MTHAVSASGYSPFSKSAKTPTAPFVRQFMASDFQSTRSIPSKTMTPFFRTDPLLYHKFENMLSQDYQKIIHFLAKRVKIVTAKVLFLLQLVVIINES